MRVNVHIAGKKPTYLKSRLAWIVWRRAQFFTPANRMIEPTSYPCLAYVYTQSDESEMPGYLYREDIEKMLKALSQ